MTRRVFLQAVVEAWQSAETNSVNPQDLKTERNHAMTDPSLDEFEAATQTAQSILRRRIEGIKQSREAQPERLAKARSDADEARGWALIEDPLESHVATVPSDGNTALELPSIVAKELWGARLAFDLLDCGDDFDRIDEVMTRLFTTAKGDTGIAFLITSAALSTIAGIVVPQLLEEIEHSGSNYDARVMLAEARVKAWHGRVADAGAASDLGDAEGRV